MVYDLTDKLNFSDDPVLVVKDVRLSVKTDAETVLKLLSELDTAANDVGNVESTVKMLFSLADQKALKGLKLKASDYLMVVRTAVKLAIGADPDEEPSGE